MYVWYLFQWQNIYKVHMDDALIDSRVAKKAARKTLLIKQTKKKWINVQFL